MSPFEALMRGVTARSIDGDDDASPKISDIGEAEVLRSMLAEFAVWYEFRPGMLVRQKPQCASMDLHSDNGLAIVVEVFAEPLIETEQSSNGPWFRQPMHMIVGSRAAMKNDAVFMLWHVDARRFEPVGDL